MEHLPHWVSDVGAVVLWVSGVLLALGVVWRYVLQPFWRGSRRFFRAIDYLQNIADHTGELKEGLPVLLEIAAQFRPDDGSSLHDQLNGLMLQQSDIMGQLENHQQWAGEYLLPKVIENSGKIDELRWLMESPGGTDD